MVAPHRETATESTPSRRAVLLGASNLVRGLSTVVAHCGDAWGRPLDILAATGHGRCYARTSWVLGQSLPPITDCGLWDALAERQAGATAALITDIGNDILYGVSDSDVAARVEVCLERLANVEAKVVVTQLPMQSLSELGPSRFKLMRSVLFPFSKLDLSTALQRAARLNERIRTLADRYGAALVEPRREWYGWDPIHVRRKHASVAWAAVFSHWKSARRQGVAAHAPGDSKARDEATRGRSSWRCWWALRRARPARRRMFGIEQQKQQPSGRLVDGTVVSFY